jgi:hypothetical protein
LHDSQLGYKNTFNRENLADIHLLFPEAISANAKSERIAENRVQVSLSLLIGRSRVPMVQQLMHRDGRSSDAK